MSLARRARPRAALVEYPTPSFDQTTGSPLGLLSGLDSLAQGSQAMAFPAVFASIRVIAETVATLPLLTYRRTQTGRDRILGADDPRVGLLHDRPNVDQTAVEMWEQLLGVILQRGKGHLWVDRRDFYGRPASLRVLAHAPRFARDEDGTRYWAIGRDSDTTLVSEPDVIPVSAFMGLSPIAVCRQAIQLGLNAQRYGAKLWENDARPGGYLKTEQALTDASFDRLKAQWAAGHQGVDNAHRFGLLEGGVSWQDVGIPPEDAQFLETRKFQITETARMFRLPPHKIGDLERATFSNIEHQAIEYVTDSILPWCVRLEQRIKLGIFSDPRDRDVFSEFLLDGLLRGDTATRYEAYNKAPWMSDNDKRQRENLPPLPGLDATYAPLNLARIIDGQKVTDVELSYQRVGLPALVAAGIVSPAWAAEQMGAPTAGLSTTPEVALEPGVI